MDNPGPKRWELSGWEKRRSFLFFFYYLIVAGAEIHSQRSTNPIKKLFRSFCSPFLYSGDGDDGELKNAVCRALLGLACSCPCMVIPIGPLNFCGISSFLETL